MKRKIGNRITRSAAALTILVCATLAGAAQVTRTSKAVPGLQKLAVMRKTAVVRPLQPAVKLARVRALLKGKPATQTLSSSTLADEVSLSVSAPVFRDAFLKFNAPSQVSPNENTAFFQPQQGYPNDGVLVSFNAPTAGTYIFDFSLKIFDANLTSPVLLSFGNLFGIDRQDLSITKDDGHILFIAQDVAAGRNYFFLAGTHSTWEFYAVDISQFKIGN